MLGCMLLLNLHWSPGFRDGCAMTTASKPGVPGDVAACSCWCCPFHFGRPRDPCWVVEWGGRKKGYVCVCVCVCVYVCVCVRMFMYNANVCLCDIITHV